MKAFMKDLLAIVASAIINIIVAIPCIAMMLMGYSQPWYVIAAIVYFCIQVLTEKYWMPAAIYNTINR